MKLTSSLYLFTLLLLISCNTSVLQFNTGSTAVQKLVITSNLHEGKTGWVTASGATPRFFIDRKNIEIGSVAKFQCRAGLKTLINSQSYVDCSSGIFSPAPTPGGDAYFPNSNGTYRFEVRALDKKNAQVATYAQDFYVHNSLDSVPTCSRYFSDEQYFNVASQYLSMADPFGSNTDLKGPIYQVEFARQRDISSYWNIFENVRILPSVRKNLRMNSEKTLMIMTRTHRKWVGSQPVAIKHNNQWVTQNDFNSYVHRHPSNDNADYQTTDAACEIGFNVKNQARENVNPIPISDGMGGYDTTFYEFRASTSLGSGVFESRVDANSRYSWTNRYDRQTVIDWYESGRGGIFRHYPSIFGLDTFLQQEVDNGNRNFKPTLGIRIHCDAIVLNSKGKGVCFSNKSLAEPVQLRTVTNAFMRSPNAGYNFSLARRKILKNQDWQNVVDTLSPAIVEQDYGRRLFLNP